MSVCARCGQALLPVAKFCPSCGLAAPVAATEAVDPLATTARADPALRASALVAEAASKAGHRGGTKPIAARAGSSPNIGAAGSSPRVASAAPAEPLRARNVAKTIPDSPTLPSAGSSSPPHAVSPNPISPNPILPNPISPKASSGFVPSQPPRQPAESYPSVPHASGSSPNLAGAGSAPALSTVAPGIGQHVLVEWANGQKYPGTVQQSAAGKHLILFGDGQSRWIDVRHISIA